MCWIKKWATCSEKISKVNGCKWHFKDMSVYQRLNKFLLLTHFGPCNWCFLFFLPSKNGGRGFRPRSTQESSNHAPVISGNHPYRYIWFDRWWFRIILVGFHFVIGPHPNHPAIWNFPWSKPSRNWVSPWRAGGATIHRVVPWGGDQNSCTRSLTVTRRNS